LPPRRSWLAASESDEGSGIFGLGFYKDVAPAALGKNAAVENIRARKISGANA